MAVSASFKKRKALLKLEVSVQGFEGDREPRTKTELDLLEV